MKNNPQNPIFITDPGGFSRTNQFRVTDEAEYAAAVEEFKNADFWLGPKLFAHGSESIIELDTEPGIHAFVLKPGIYYPPACDDECAMCCAMRKIYHTLSYPYSFFKFMFRLQRILPCGQAFILTGVCENENHKPVGYAMVMTRDKVKTVTLDCWIGSALDNLGIEVY